VNLRAITVALALPFCGTCACGTVVDEVAYDGGGSDGTTLDSSVDVVAADVPSGTEAGLDAACDVGVADMAAAAPACSEAGVSGSPPHSSCAPGGAGMSNCGACGESCCASLEVEGGTYYRTYASSSCGPTGEADPATVSGFRLDKYVVTVGRFRQFVNAVMPTDAGPRGYVPPAGSGKHTHLNGGLGLAKGGNPGTYETGWVASDDRNIALTIASLSCGISEGLGGDVDPNTWTPSPGSNENLPMTCVNWYDSYAFCIWDGGFLPSEAEWEYAAAAGSQQREYPWGSMDPGTDNQYAIYGCHYGSSACIGASTVPGLTNIAPVGTATRGAGLWGQLDMAGDVSEWVLDGYAPYVDPCVDCAYLEPAPAPASRVVRGGDFFDSTTTALLSTYRAGIPGYTGFRCARTP
jgi:sulfatase modifying factor 1